ncbi:MAG: sulfatase-like hydrolase/transferase [Lentisphaerae bacterium]|nr:sulfatase-like hydrolase/transferase [Lentisphaerota bacterium]
MANEWAEWQWQYYIWSYYRHVEMVDAEVDRVLQALEDNGCSKDTLVVFTADHGEGTAHHQTTRKNNLYDEAARVPLMVSWPGHVPENHCDTSHVVSGLDIVPTICDYVGCEAPPNVRGASLRPLLEGKPDASHSFCVSEVSNNTGRMVRTAGFKYITYRDDPTEQLFDMNSDPGETRNLAGDAQFAETLAEHKRLLREWELQLDVAPNVPAPDTWRG